MSWLRLDAEQLILEQINVPVSQVLPNVGELRDGQLGLGEEVLCDSSYKVDKRFKKVNFIFTGWCAGVGAPPTQDEGPQVRLQAPELIGVILQLFLCYPPGVAVGVVRYALLVQPL